jgi:hypothetical protein
MTFSKALIGLFFFCGFAASILSGSVLHYDGLFPFPSWSLFSEVKRHATGVYVEVKGADFGPCSLEVCPLKNRTDMMMIYVRDVANVIGYQSGPTDSIAKDLEEKLSYLAGGPVEFRIYTYRIDLKDMSRDFAGKKLVFESAGLP